MEGSFPRRYQPLEYRHGWAAPECRFGDPQSLHISECGEPPGTREVQLSDTLDAYQLTWVGGFLGPHQSGQGTAFCQSGIEGVVHDACSGLIHTATTYTCTTHSLRRCTVHDWFTRAGYSCTSHGKLESAEQGVTCCYWCCKLLQVQH